MFKGGLIENNAYYVWRKRVLLFGFPFAMSMGITSHILTDLPIYWVILGVIAILIIYIEYRIQKKFKEVQPDKILEIRDKTISIKTKKGELINEIPAENYDEIEINISAKLTDDTAADMYKNARKGYSKNYIRLKKNTESVNFDFVIESYYMLEQMKKVAQHWKALGYNINLVLREN